MFNAGNGRRIMNDRPLQLIAEAAVHLDRENAWLLFASFAGDVERTAIALNVPAVAVLKVAEDEGWLARLAPIIALTKTKRPGDLERAINRALNYVQAHTFRLIVERTIQRVTNMGVEEFERYMLSKLGKEGMEPALNTRPLADLASALEKAHAMTYAALEDTSADRVKRKDTQTEVSATDMYAKMAEAMSKVNGSKAPRALLFDAQLEAAGTLAVKAGKNLKPEIKVNDEHKEEN